VSSRNDRSKGTLLFNGGREIMLTGNDILDARLYFTDWLRFGGSILTASTFCVGTTSFPGLT